MAKVAWIGLGNMGTPMATNLVKAGHEVTVWNRTKEKTAPVVEAGAKAANTPAEAAKDAEFIFTMISDSDILELVTIGKDGAVESMGKGSILIDMSTVSIDSSAKVNKAIEAKGAKFLRGPVSGSTVLATAGTLTVLCSGPKDAYEKTLPLFAKLSKAQFHLGEGDEARTMKLALNMMIATSIQMLSESLVLCEKAGLNWNTVFDVINGSVLNSPFVAYKSPPLRERKFTPAFSAKLMSKDLDLALATAKRLGVSVPSTAITKQMIDSVCAQGMADLDFAAIVILMEKMAGIANPVINK